MSKPKEQLCAKCGAELAAFATEGFCSACLLERGLGALDATSVAATERVTSAASEAPGDRIDRYKLLQQIGEGGCGVVYMAEQTEPVRRRVALKVIKLGMDTRQVIGRFEAERQALALMDHPNIAKVFDAGATGTGRPYFVMELVKGIRITDYCDQNHLSTRQRLDLFTQVCQAIQHAHQKGIIHRDIKPSNILVTLHDGVPVPKVIDFGIAKATEQPLTEKTVFTALGQFMGTPAYMSPEQAELSGLDIDTRSDIYALGVLLYELLTGRTPFDAKELWQAGLDEMRRRIREEEPVRPSTRLSTMTDADLTQVAQHRQSEPAKLTRFLRGDLDWIVMKCLEKDRTRRYETANGLATDLRRHLDNEPVLACPPSATYRFQKLVRRNKLGFAAVSAVAAALVIGLGIAAWQVFEKTKAYNRAVAAEKQAGIHAKAEEAQRKQAESQREHNRQRLVRAHVSQGAQLVEQGDYFGALPWFVEALNIDQGHPDEEEHHRMRIAAVLEQSPRLFHTWFHQGPVRHAEFSSDGRSILTASQDRTACVWDTFTGVRRAVFQHADDVQHAAFSPDGEHVVTACADGTVVIWDVATAKPIGLPMKHEARVNRAVFSADGRRIVSASEDKTARIWEAATGEPLAVALGHGAGVKDARFRPDGRHIATISSDTSIRIWDSTTGKQIHSSPAYSRYVFGVSYSSDGSRLVGASWGKALVLDGKSGSRIAPILEHLQGIRSADFSHDGKRIITASEDQTVRVWDSTTGHELIAPLRHPHSVTRASFSPTGQWIITACDDGVARIWDAKTSEPVAPFLKQSGPLTEACFSPGGSYVLTAGSDGTVRLWDMASSQPRSVPLDHGDQVRQIRFSTDGRWVLTTSADRIAQVWEASTGRRSGPRLEHSSAVLDGCFSRDGSRVATASMGGTAEVWDRASGRKLFPSLLHTGEVVRIQFSKAGRQLLTVSGNKLVNRTARQELNISESPVFVQTWDVETGRPITGSIPLENSLGPLDVSADGLRIVTACKDGFFRIWATTTGQFLATLPITNGFLMTVTFSPDGGLVATAVTKSDVGEVSVWETSTGRPLAPPIKHRKFIYEMTFSRDGRRIVTASADGTARLWDTATSQPTTPPLVHQFDVFSADFSLDGRRVVTGSGDHTARVWDAQTGELIGPPYQHNGYVIRVVFSPDGHQILSAMSQSVDVTKIETAAQLWHLPTDSRTVEDLQRAAEILSSHRIDATSSLVPLESETLPVAWSNFVQKSSGPKSGVDELAPDWHWRKMEQAEKSGRWSVVLLHAERLMASGTNLTRGGRTEDRLKLARAGVLCKTGRFEEAQKLVSELPPATIQAEAQTAGKVIHALGRWAAGENRWREAAAHYNVLVYGAANGIGLEREFHPMTMAYTEYAALLVTLGDTNRYLALREAALRNHGATRNPTAGERMLITSLLWPLEPTQMAAMTNWGNIAVFTPQNPKELEA